MATEEDKEELNSSDTENQCYKLSKSQGRISNRLLDIYDNLWENEQLAQKVYIGGSLDSVVAWEQTVPNPTYVAPRRRKSTIQEEPVVDENDKKDDKLNRDYELEFVNCSPWKIGVEPFTYRYMGNNGRYRAYKLARKLVNSNKMKPTHIEMGKLNPDKRLLQREIQRELRKEFDIFVKTEREVSALYRQKELAAANIKQKKKKPDKTEPKTIEVSQEKEVEAAKIAHEESKALAGSDTPRSHLSILSSQTPLPPITIPLLSTEKEEPKVKHLSKSMDDLSSVGTDNARKEKLWHVPTTIHGDSDSETKDTPRRRFEWSAQAILLQSASEPPSRTSPRISRSTNKSAPPVKTEVNTGSAYRLQKLPTISDFNDNEFESSQDYIGQKEVLLGQGYQVKTNDQDSLQKRGPKRQEYSSYKQQITDDTISVTSEPVRFKSPVLQGTAYDIKKLRASANHYQQLYPDNMNTVGDIHTISNGNMQLGYKSAQDYNKDRDSAVSATLKGYRIKEEMSQPQDLKVISTKQYVNTKTRTGLNPYLRKPRPGSNAVHQQLFTMEEPEIAEALATIPISEPAPGLSNHVRRGDVMPDMLVRRAELSVSNKRVI